MPRNFKSPVGIIVPAGVHHNVVKFRCESKARWEIGELRWKDIRRAERAEEKARKKAEEKLDKAAEKMAELYMSLTHHTKGDRNEQSD